jgi:hypothetical protein
MSLEIESSSAETALRIPTFTRVSEERNVIVFKTAHKGSRVVATAGHHVLAESGSTVLAMPGAKVAALNGSKVLECKGAHIVVHPGSTIVVMDSGKTTEEKLRDNSRWQTLEQPAVSKSSVGASSKSKNYSVAFYAIDSIFLEEISPLSKFFPRFVRTSKMQMDHNTRMNYYRESLAQRLDNLFPKRSSRLALR